MLDILAQNPLLTALVLWVSQKIIPGFIPEAFGQIDRDRPPQRQPGPHQT